MDSKLYIGNLSYNLTEEELKETFSQAGEVTSALIIKDKFSNRSKGFGFVEMTSEEDANKAIEMFNNKELDGRNIIVSIARPKEDKPRSFGGASRGGFSGGSRGGYNSGASRGGYNRE